LIVGELIGVRKVGEGSKEGAFCLDDSCK
jgi:hypothetical protein